MHIFVASGAAAEEECGGKVAVVVDVDDNGIVEMVKESQTMLPTSGIVVVFRES